MDIITQKGMKILEDVTAAHYMSVIQMMENAGKGCADYIQKKFSVGEFNKVLVLCGHGNNGGDGFVIARYLARQNYQVDVVFVGAQSKMTVETKTNYERCRDLPIKMYFYNIEAAETETTTTTAKPEPFLDTNYNLIIDAVFGTGFKGEVNDRLFQLLTKLFAQRAMKIAIDVPSGINANTGHIHLECKKDHLFPKFNFTFTLGYPKIGLYLNDAPIYRGVVMNFEIGIPKIQKLAEYDNTLETIIAREIYKLKYPQKMLKLNHRFRTSNKGDYGRVGIVGGSRGYTGAAILASRAALLSGAGLTSLYHQPGLDTVFDIALVEVMTRGFDPLNLEDTANLLKNDIILIGPGLGKTKWALDTLTFVIDRFTDKPIFFDADALNLLAENAPLLKKISGRNHMYLTPHVAEFSRLSGISVGDINDDPFKALQSFCLKYQVSILLKNHYCIFYNHQDKVKSQALCIGGHDGLSKGGTGDVLAGMLVSLFIQRLFMLQKTDIINTEYSVNISNIFYSIVQYFYYIADKLTETYETPAITPSMIIDNIFRRTNDN